MSDFHDGACGCQGKQSRSHYDTRGSGGRMKLLHHPEKGVLSVTKIKIGILKIFVAQNCKNINNKKNQFQ